MNVNYCHVLSTLTITMFVVYDILNYVKCLSLM